MATAVLLLSFMTALSPAFAEEAGAIAPAGLAASAFPKPDRPVAEIISPIWASEKERDAVDESGQIIRALGLRPGMNVADLGAGSGFHAVRLARALGPTSRVFAEDVMPDYLAGLRKRVAKESLANITVIRGEPHDPRLPVNSIDVAILVHMYHEISQPFGLLYNLIPAFRPGGRLGIVDLDAPIGSHGTRPSLLRCELSALGFKEASLTTLKGDVGYLAVFVPPDVAARITPDKIKVCAAPRG